MSSIRTRSTPLNERVAGRFVKRSATLVSAKAISSDEEFESEDCAETNEEDDCRLICHVSNCN
jgi:hypothetical protein